MNNFKSIMILFLATSFAFSTALMAQDAPPVPKTETGKQQSQDSEQELKPSESETESSPQEESKPDDAAENKPKADEKLGEEGESQDDSDEKNSEMKQADQAADEKADKGDTEKADEKADKKDTEKADKEDTEKADQEDGDEKEADEKSDDDQQADENKADKTKDEDQADTKKPTGLSRWTRDAERLKSFSKQSEEFVSVFDSVVASVNDSTLLVMSGKRQIALGTVVDSNGLVLTKASELRGNLHCKLNDGSIVEAKVIGIDPETDLAMLKVDVENMNVAQWSEEPTPVTGRWLATPKGSSDRATIGVVSVESREIPPSRPFIGIVMINVEGGKGVRIDKVVPSSPADFADLWVNDVIVKIDETDVTDNLTVRDALGQYDVNDRVTLTVLRGDKERKIKLTLAERDKISPENQRSNQQNSMGSILSRRRKDFPNAFQHDSMLTSNTCGGPIVDLSGKVVGINIARAGRVSSLALPVELVREKVALLKTGELAPEVVNKAKIEQINVELKEINGKLTHLPEKKDVLERRYNVENARMDELKKSMDELKNRLKVIEEKSSNYKSELDSVRKEIRGIEKVRQRLEADREQLRTGSR